MKVDQDGRYVVPCEFCGSLSYVEPQELWLSPSGKHFLCWRCGAFLVVHWSHVEGYSWQLRLTSEEGLT